MYYQIVAEDTGDTSRSGSMQDKFNVHSARVMAQLRSLVTMKLLSQVGTVMKVL